MYYLYRFLNEQNEIIYVGRTNDLKRRFSEHFGKNGHLPKECYEETVRVDYLVVPNQNDMLIAELYYISKYKTKFNVLNSGETTIQINEHAHAWAVYRDENVNIVQNEERTELLKVVTELREARAEISRQERLKKQLMDEVVYLRKKLSGAEMWAEKIVEKLDLYVSGEHQKTSKQRELERQLAEKEVLINSLFDEIEDIREQVVEPEPSRQPNKRWFSFA